MDEAPGKTAPPSALAHLCTRAPLHWYGRQAVEAWARLLAKVYELDVLACPHCGSRMAVIAVILDPAEIRKIIN
ncbi:MAG: hypothetical protein NT005_06105 [Spirochaetes bacterium]|nr:hypothetical protein [Spirochaetota bacterium]